MIRYKETAAMFTYPTGLFIDVSGNIFVGEAQPNIRIREITGIPNTTTGITPLSAVSDMRLYPIPSSNQLTLALTLKDNADIRLELINSEGAKVANTSAVYGAGYQELNLSVQALPTGLYVANIYSGNEVSRQKVVVVR